KIMNILLINPSFNLKEQYGEAGKILSLRLPMGLLYIATYLEKQGVNVKIVDAQIQELSKIFFEKYFEHFLPDIVGISACTPTFHEALRILSIIKSISPSIKTSMGGIHPSFFSENVLKHNEVDFVIRGEGEITFWESINKNFDLTGIDGISYKNDNGIVIHNKDRVPISNLDILPFPNRKLLPFEKYVETIITSRGCPFNCIFCSAKNILGEKYRTRSALNVVEEIGSFIENGTTFFFVLDDNFCVNKKRVEEICLLLIQKNYHKKIEWGCETRVDLVDEKMLNLMRKSGCIRIFFGLETHSQKLLDTLNKNVKIEENEKAVKLAQKSGMEVRGSFILGIPGETKEESIKTIKYAKKLKLTEAKFSLITPYPGTKLFEIAQNEGLKITEQDWPQLSTVSGFSNYQPVYVPKGRNKKELVRLQMRAYLEFYLQFYQIKRIYKEIKSIKDFFKFFKIFIDIIMKMVKKR
ncbi:MAG: radical SAM protein, partial [bacterium]